MYASWTKTAAAVTTLLPNISMTGKTVCVKISCIVVVEVMKTVSNLKKHANNSVSTYKVIKVYCLNINRSIKM